MNPQAFSSLPPGLPLWPVAGDGWWLGFGTLLGKGAAKKTLWRGTMNTAEIEEAIFSARETLQNLNSTSWQALTLHSHQAFSKAQD